MLTIIELFRLSNHSGASSALLVLHGMFFFYSNDNYEPDGTPHLTLAWSSQINERSRRVSLRASLSYDSIGVRVITELIRLSSYSETSSALLVLHLKPQSWNG